MNNFFETVNWKILVLILLGVFGLILITGNLLNSSLEPKKTEEKVVPTLAEPSLEISRSFSSSDSLVTWKLYETNQYELTYPSDWKTEEFFHINGSVTTRIKPGYLSEGGYYPSIDISVENSSSAAILENSYASMPAFRKIGNKYRTTSMAKMVGKEKINSPVQEVAVFLNKDNRVYFFEYKYDGEKESREHEELFGRIINSLVSLPTQQQ